MGTHYSTSARQGASNEYPQLMFSWENKKNIFLICGAMVKVFVCDEVLWPSQPNGVMSSAVSLPNHTITGQA